MKNITRTFLTGLVTVVPVVATFYLLFWLAVTAESLLGGTLRFLVPGLRYWPGLGVALGIMLVFLVGLLMRMWVVRKTFSWAEALLFRLPLVKSIYGALRDFFSFVSQPREKGLEQVVAVKVGDAMRVIGFVTRRDLTGLPKGISDDGSIAVYMPMSYQIGGYTVLVPRSAVQPVDMSLEEAMRFALTAGVSTVSRGSAVASQRARRSPSG